MQDVIIHSNSILRKVSVRVREAQPDLAVLSSECSK